MSTILNVSVYQRERKTLFNLDFNTDITGYYIYFTVKSEFDSVVPVIATVVSEHTNAAEGLTSIVVAEGETNQTVGDYYYEIRYMNSATSEKVTLLTGMLSILPTVVGIVGD
jgi:hypothetical protein